MREKITEIQHYLLNFTFSALYQPTCIITSINIWALESAGKIFPIPYASSCTIWNRFAVSINLQKYFSNRKFIVLHLNFYYLSVSGYRCFKTTMFLTGFIFASSIVYLICLQGELMPDYGNVGKYRNEIYINNQKEK